MKAQSLHWRTIPRASTVPYVLPVEPKVADLLQAELFFGSSFKWGALLIIKKWPLFTALIGTVAESSVAAAVNQDVEPPFDVRVVLVASLAEALCRT